jgi:hypothetical protein
VEFRKGLESSQSLMLDIMGFYKNKGMGRGQIFALKGVKNSR